MFSDRRSLPVFHERDLDAILIKMGLLEKFHSGELRCYFCETPITLNDFGGFFKTKEKNIEVFCGEPNCFKKVGLEIDQLD